jgi:hypothetical protein
VVDDVCGVVLDVEVTTGETNEGEALLARLDAVAETTGRPVATVTADAGYAYAKIFGGLERRGIDAVIPNKAEWPQFAFRERLTKGTPMRRFLHPSSGRSEGRATSQRPGSSRSSFRSCSASRCRASRGGTRTDQGEPDAPARALF